MAGTSLIGIERAFETYLRFISATEVLGESWNKAFHHIPGFANIARQETEKPYIGRLLYIQGIIRKRTGARRYNCIDYLEHVHLCGGDLDRMENHAKAITSIDEFESLTFDG